MSGDREWLLGSDLVDSAQGRVRFAA